MGAPNGLATGMSAASRTTDLDAYLPRLGLSSFRPGQRDVLTALLDGSDCLCIMPTGGGKSLCYQLPAIIRDGLTVVVSPLIALMKDQVDELQRQGIRAELINSSLSTGEQQQRLEGIENHEYDLVYVAPERFRSQRFVELLQATSVSLLAVDEAHCISEWGHDFRHDYARLGRYRRRIGNPQTIALTATATPDVRADIVKQLELDNPKIFVAGFSRPNLSFQVQQSSGRSEKEQRLQAFLQSHSGTGIIYASTRKACDELSATLNLRDPRNVGVYHAGLEQEERRRIQEEFMTGKLDIVVATNAFGMGIDKADIRFVVHFNMPGTVEAFYQEAGRAGRDGQPAACLLLFSHQDRHIQEFFIESAYPDRSVVETVYEFLRDHPDDPIEITQQELRETLKLSISNEGVGTCERLLEKSGIMERLEPHRNMAIVRLDSDLPTLIDLVPRQAKVQRKVLQLAEKVVGHQRHEPVYFQPQQWANDSGLAMNALAKALRELSGLDAFHFVPPFRGRAVHMTQRDLSFDQLDIDFDTMIARKQADYEKLDSMQRFAKTVRCRQMEIVRYFGDSTGETCGSCDNCSQPESSDGAARFADLEQLPNQSIHLGDDAAVLEATRIALSGVARAQERFGKNLIAGMLCGSRSAKITKWRLDQLSTFGLLRHLTQVEVGHFLDSLARADLLQQNEVDKFRPVLKLSDTGREVMVGSKLPANPLKIPPTIQQKLTLYYRPASRPKVDQPAASSPHKEEKIGSADSPPDSVECRETNVASSVPDPEPRPFNPRPPIPRPSIPRPPIPRPPIPQPIVRRDPPVSPAKTSPVAVEVNIQPSYYWTWRLMQAGFSLPECATIRDIEPNLIVDHMIQAVEQGWDVNLEWLLTRELIGELQESLEVNPDIGLKGLTQRFSGRASQSRILFFLKCRSTHK